MSNKRTEKPHYLGHRKRLKERFMKLGIESLQDYEVVELLLTFSIPQKDVKPMAKELLKRFSSISGIFNASADELQNFPFIKENTLTLLTFIKELNSFLRREKAMQNSVSMTKEDIVHYCMEKLGNEKDEEFRIIFLDSKMSIIGDDSLKSKDLFVKGTVDRATVYPRKVLESALQNKAYAIVLTHNHPNGNPEPSEQDKTLTKAIEIPAKMVGITIFDHIIVTSRSYFSFKENKLL